MSSYSRLADYLANHKGSEWEASFSEIESKIGRPLPPSAYKYPAWWANQAGPGHSQTRAWRSVGWKTSKLDLERRRVRFERDRKAHGQGDADGSGRNVESLLRQAMAVSGLADRDEVLIAALQAFIRNEAARGLIAAGGTMPDFEAAPRERPWN